MIIQQIPQRLQEVNTLLATCKQDGITFEQALLLSLFYKDFNETNQIPIEVELFVVGAGGFSVDAPHT